jgi:peptide/nickel transport system permease protein
LFQYTLKRFSSLMPVLLGISLISFATLQFIPGDPVTVRLGERATPEQVAAIRSQLGLDQPLWVQYLEFLKHLLQGDLGTSIISGNPITSEIVSRWPATVELAIAAMVFAGALGIPLGIVAAVYQHRWPDQVARISSLLGVSLPVYWLGLLLVYGFAVSLNWLPASDRLDIAYSLSFQPITGFYSLDAILRGQLDVLLNVWLHLFLPACTLGTIPLAIITRITRSALLDVLTQPYIRTAYAKGLPRRWVVGRHALKNALLPITTVAGLQFGTLLGGAILTETIFAWPGMGTWVYEGILNRDYPVIQGGVLVLAILFVLVNVAIDLMYSWLDPRIRH